MFTKQALKNLAPAGILISAFLAANTAAAQHDDPLPETGISLAKNYLPAPPHPSAETQPVLANYIYYEGRHSGFGTSGNSESAFARVFYAFAKDKNTGDNILCSGARIETKGEKTPADIELRTTSKTLHQLWRPVAGDNENVAEYGSCIKVNSGELDYRTIEFVMDGVGTNDEYIVLKNEPTKELNLFDFQRNLVNEKYDGLFDLYDQDPRWGAFVAESDQYLQENSYRAGVDVEECANAGYFFEETLEMSQGILTKTLPLCDRPSALTP